MGANLLRLYREENERVRTSPSPPYFRRYPTFDDVADKMPEASKILGAARAASERHDRNLATFAEVETALVDLATTESEAFLGEIDAIEERAATRVAEEWHEEATRPAKPAAAPRLKTVN
jgi:hypothetical protein